MTDRDPIDRTFTVFLVVAFIFLIGLAFAIFPRHDATANASPNASGADKAGAVTK
jgi:hypothetical protein